MARAGALPSAGYDQGSDAARWGWRPERRLPPAVGALVAWVRVAPLEAPRLNLDPP